MAPNLKDTSNNTSTNSAFNLDEELPIPIPKKEILYDGNYYDVTNFISRHPGGYVIDYYTNNGEDATVPILEFHNRSKERVTAIMKALPKRPAKETESKQYINKSCVINS
jgi:cytochrome b involved in lipid metabolism